MLISPLVKFNKDLSCIAKNTTSVLVSHDRHDHVVANLIQGHYFPVDSVLKGSRSHPQ